MSLLTGSLLFALSAVNGTTPVLGNALPFQHFGSEHGLNSIDVYYATQDRAGFIWVGGRNGLTRFDGERFREPTFKATAEAQISARMATQSLFTDSRGIVWFGAQDQGLLRLDPDTFVLEKVANVGTDVWSTSENADGTLWFGPLRGGLIHANADGSARATYVHDPEKPGSLCGESVMAQGWLTPQRLAVGTLEGGLCVLDVASGRFSRLPLEPTGLLDEQSINAIATDRDGNLLIGTNEGMFVIARGSQQATQFKPDPTNPQSLSDQVVRMILTDRRGLTWVATTVGLNLWDPATRSFQVFRRLRDDWVGLRADVIYSLFEDAEGGIWLPTVGGGLSRLPSDFERFRWFKHDAHEPLPLPSGPVEALASDRVGELWIGSRTNGLVRRAKGQANQGWLQRGPTTTAAARVRSLALTPDTVWIGSQVGMRRLDRATGALDSGNWGPREPINTFVMLASGAALAGRLGGGLLRIEPDGSSTALDELITVEQVLALANDHALVAASNGLWYSDGRTLEPIRLGREGGISAMLLTGDQLALATSSGMIEGRLVGRKFLPERETPWPPALVPMVVGSLWPGANGDLLVATRRGLVLAHSPRGRFTQMDERFGLPCVEFSDRPTSVQSDGWVYAAMACGAVAFQPQNVDAQIAPPPPVQWLDLSVERADGAEQLNPALPARLVHTDVALRFAVAALGFDRRAAVEIKLDGLDAQFTQIKAGEIQRLTQLPPGRFRLRARAVGEDGTAGPEALPIDLEVRAAPWATPSAFMAYGLIALLALMAAWYIARGRLRAAHDAREMRARVLSAEQHLEFAEKLNRALEPDEVLKTLHAGLKRTIQHDHSALKLLHSEASEPDPETTLRTLIHHRKRIVASVVLTRDSTAFSARDQAVAQVYRAQAEVALDKGWLLLEAHLLAEKAENANRAKGAFLAKMSHEIRTPLHGILGMAEMLERRTQDPASREDLAALNRAGGALLSVLNDVLDLSQLQAERYRLRSETFALRGLLREVTELFLPAAKSRGLELQWRVSKNLPLRLIASRQALRQVLMNLVGNAVKFTQHGNIELSADASDGVLLITLSDTGPGIPAAQLPTLFEPFAQGDAAPAGNVKGSGLGLAIVQELVTLMGGTVSVSSTLGMGTEFQLRLPFKAAERCVWALTRSAENGAFCAQQFDSVYALIAALGAEQPDEIWISRVDFGAVELAALATLEMLAPDTNLTEHSVP